MKKNSTRSLFALLNKWRDAFEGRLLPQPPFYDGPDLQLTSIVEHSDLVTPGACFVARIRTGTDGHPYIGKAISRGASLVLGQLDPAGLDVDLGGVPYLQVENTGIVEACLAAAWHDFPSQHLIMIGVTGTDGKSTTVNLIYQILRSSGIKTGMLSTIKAAIGEDEEPLALHVTTPEAPIIQEYLRRMVDAGLTHCVIEATSHGLSQDRVGAIDFDLAVITNITHEHLDYHGSFEEYLDAKSKLFRMIETVYPPPGSISPVGDTNHIEPANLSRQSAGHNHQIFKAIQKSNIQKTAVLNRDDDSYFHLAKLPAQKQLTYGLESPVDVFASNIIYETGSTSFDLNLPASRSKAESAIHINSSMVGPFNIYNMMAAASAAHAIGINGQDIKSGLESEIMLKGRMQSIDHGQSFSIIVDFAHTPNALLEAITAARSLTSGRVITVFGSAGKRDVQKRRMMAEISVREADITVLTAEDPRTEALEEILDMMSEGCRNQGGVEGQTFWRINDRGQAIYFAMTLSRQRDLILICGKGHEQSMCFGTTEFPWDDIEATRVAVESVLSGEPMPDLGLPTFSSEY